MVKVGLKELKSLHNDLSCQLSWKYKFGKYVLIVTVYIVFSQIPSKAVDNHVICCERCDRNASTFNNFLSTRFPWTNYILVFLYVPQSASYIDSSCEGTSVTVLQDIVKKHNTDEETTFGLRDKICSDKPSENFSQCTACTISSDITKSKIHTSRRVRKSNTKLLNQEIKDKQLLRKSCAENTPQTSDKEIECMDQRQERVSRCNGERAQVVVVYLGITLLILIFLLTMHDVWIELSDKEIGGLRKFVLKTKELQICEDCAKVLLQRVSSFFHEATKPNEFCEDCKKARLTSIQTCLRRTLLQDPPKLNFMVVRYIVQNVLCLILLIVADFPFQIVVAYNYEGYECRNGTNHYVVCYDGNREILMSAYYTVHWLIVLLTVLAIHNIVRGFPYTSLLKALNDKSE